MAGRPFRMPRYIRRQQKPYPIGDHRFRGLHGERDWMAGTCATNIGAEPENQKRDSLL
jgi:hypothetical protein